MYKYVLRSILAVRTAALVWTQTSDAVSELRVASPDASVTTGATLRFSVHV